MSSINTCSPSLPGLSARQGRQLERIENGLSSGQLTQREAGGLMRQQARISDAMAAAQSDGVVTLAEKARIHNMQDRASGDIFEQKHDAQRGRPDLQPGIVQRQVNQLDRISQGVTSGSLSAGETSTLLRQQAQVTDSVVAGRSDNHFTPSERFAVHGQMDASSQLIYNLKHNPVRG